MINPYEFDDRDGIDIPEHPLYCRGCGGYLGEYETADPAEIVWFNGWSWCRDHGEEMQRLAQSPDAVNEVRR